MKKLDVLNKIKLIDGEIREVEAQISIMSIRSVREKMEKYLKNLHVKADKLVADLDRAN
ncbi:hypothetical protein [Paenibacillus gallinarum]|uniref:Uncharacterized protein n=1 Tax=Paenibacillus gallinarum TaxID=2762232 RepID=A0ABR8T450_9BACL|nr:hypothetical protein [Paenibacillus gallinarum]MBD7970369.1 hypothetical protein [Paenibacillus gallinarum]